MSITKFKNKLLKKDKDFAEAYQNFNSAFEIANYIIEARIDEGLSQTQLAKKVGTNKSSIARVESGAVLPSISFREKIAKALGTEIPTLNSKSSIESSKSYATGYDDYFILGDLKMKKIEAVSNAIDMEYKV